MGVHRLKPHCRKTHTHKKQHFSFLCQGHPVCLIRGTVCFLKCAFIELPGVIQRSESEVRISPQQTKTEHEGFAKFYLSPSICEGLKGKSMSVGLPPTSMPSVFMQLKPLFIIHCQFAEKKVKILNQLGDRDGSFDCNTRDFKTCQFGCLIAALNGDIMT